MGSNEGVLRSPGGKTAQKNNAAKRSGETMASLGDELLTYKNVKYGDIVRGVVVMLHPNEVLVDIGTKSEALLAQKETEQLGREGFPDLHEGDEVVAFVLKPEDRDGSVIISFEKAQIERDWMEAERVLQDQSIVEAPVIGFNKGGLIVAFGQVRGFVPASQLEMASRRPGELNDDDLQNLVGKKLKFKIIEIDRNRKRLILSERLAMREVRRDQKERLYEEIKEGDVRTGTVTSIADFGVFVDLGMGVEGLVHISELSWTKAGHPKDVVSVGQTVQVQILSVDREKNRIALSIKRLQPEPWQTIEERYHVGQLVTGTITKLAAFGAFARVDDIEGLIHISELAEHRVNHPQEVVKEGETLTLRVIKIDPARRRLGLSLKRVEDPTGEYAAYDAVANAELESGTEDVNLEGATETVNSGLDEGVAE